MYDPIRKSLNVLVISRWAADSERLKASYAAPYRLAGFERVETMLEAVQQLQAGDYHFCMIAGDYSAHEVKNLLVDYQKLGKSDPLVLIGFSEKPSNKKQDVPEIIGEISFEATTVDDAVMRRALDSKARMLEIEEKKTAVTSAVNAILRNLDSAARNLSRGRLGRVSGVFGSFIKNETEFDQRVLDAYYEDLLNRTGEALPDLRGKLSIPDRMTRLNLPSLTTDSYTGASDRVWRKLKQRFPAGE